MKLWLLAVLFFAILSGCTVDGASDIYPLHIEYRAIDNVCYNDLVVHNNSEKAAKAAFAFLAGINLLRECTNIDDGWTPPESKKYYNIYVHLDGSWSDY